MTSSPLEQLVQNLEEQIKVYRHLLDVVRKEKEILISANLDDLNETNRTKEAMLLKIRGLEADRLKHTAQVCQDLGLSMDDGRLTEIARVMGGDDAERLRNIHSVLELLLRRVQEFNKQNEALVQSALETVTGAMNAVKGALQEKPTYKKKGEIEGSTLSGQLVSKEA